MSGTQDHSPSTDWKEIVEPDEDEIFEGFAREIEAQQERVSRERKIPLARGFHAKLHAGFIAQFNVLPDLPAYARFGIFREPRSFPAVLRFSNGKPFAQADKHPEPRGIAIKLLGVPGRKLLPGQEDAVTQDFLATSHSVTSAVRNAHQFMAFVRSTQRPSTMPYTLARQVGFREAGRILGKLVRTVALSRVRSLATEEFSGTAPIRLGPYAVKFTIRPAAGTQPTKQRAHTHDFLKDDLADRLRSGDLFFDFLLQFYVDEGTTPIEDTSVEWNPAKSPFVKVAQVRIPACDLDQPATRQISEAVDRFAFSPWHTTEEHRPLGSIMRARRTAYRASSARREAAIEPDTLPS